jgi:selenocysteine lyase/cysteine desulfurase
MNVQSRRVFLGGLGAGVALFPASANDESYWGMVRRQFAFHDNKVPMNAANLCPSPRSVADCVSEMTREIDVDCSSQNRKKFDRLREEARSKVAAQLGVSSDEIALVRNTSEANNTINNGVPLKSGDEVVMWDQNHPTNNVAWDVRAARFGLTVKRVSTPAKPGGIESLIAAFEQAMTPRTRLLAVTHVSNVSGVRLPVRELGELARRRGIYFHVDGAQTWGALRVNLRELGCDSYSASAHKWFMGPKEAGLLYVRAERIAEVWPNIVAPGWGVDVDPDVKGARKFESLGQRDDACLAALGTIADFHDTLGPPQVDSRVVQLAAALKTGLAETGAELVTPMDPQLSGGVVIMKVPSKNSGQVLDRLYLEHGIAGSTAGGLRLCPHVYNTMEHVERAVRGVKALRELWAA